MIIATWALQQACSQEFAQGGSDFVETQESHTYFVYFVYFLKCKKEGGKYAKTNNLSDVLYVFY